MSENLPSQLQETLLLAPQSHYDPDPNAIMFYFHEEIQQNVLQPNQLNDSLKQIMRIN
jgi:hypothetical protein